MWGVELKGKLEPIALARRRSAQVYAGRRLISGTEARRAYGRDNIDEFLPFGNVKALWKEVKKQQPTVKLVRLRLVRS